MASQIEYALMAGGSYITTRPEINRFPAPDGWLEQVDQRRTESSERSPDAMKWNPGFFAPH